VVGDGKLVVCAPGTSQVVVDAACGDISFDIRTGAICWRELAMCAHKKNTIASSVRFTLQFAGWYSCVHDSLYRKYNVLASTHGRVEASMPFYKARTYNTDPYIVWDSFGLSVLA
jgi:hypothetical protein